MSTVLQTPWKLIQPTSSGYYGIVTDDEQERAAVEWMEEPGAGEGGIPCREVAEHIITLHNDWLKTQKWTDILFTSPPPNAAPPAAPEIPSTFVFLDITSRPFLIHDGWLHRWHPDKVWVTTREVRPDEIPAMAARKLKPEHAALYNPPAA